MYDDNRNDFLAQEQRIGQQVAGEQQVAVYLAKVMGWMCLGLFTTAVFALLTLRTEFLFRLVFMSAYGYLGVIIAQLAVVLIFSFSFQRVGPAMATVMFMGYSALTGLTMAVFALAYDLQSLVTAFGLTTGLFLLMSLYGFFTKRDLTRIGSLMLFALVGVILSSVINLFWYSSTVDFAICVIAVVIFIVLIAYDTQKIKGFYLGAVREGHDGDGDLVRKFAIFGALQLYLDFINMFLRLLRLLGRRRN